MCEIGIENAVLVAGSKLALGNLRHPRCWQAETAS
jgi:hypothetical protein